ncbi:MAG: hypothetical protein Q8P22_08445 [Chloroflexota bacterium]|nr:hypothetical protein [Chloroflexota bacterium]
MSPRWQRVLILGGVVIGVAIVALLAVIVYVLLSGDDGADTEVARVTPTAARSPTARPTVRATASPTASLPTPRPEPGQPSPVVTIVPGQATPPAAGQPAATPAPSAPTPQPATPTSAAACPGPPVLSSFTANPSTVTAGEWTTLSWGAVTNATSVVIDQGIGSVQAPGSVVVAVATTTTLTMTASGCGGTTTLQATVTVNPPPPTPTPTLPPPTPTPTEQAPPPGGGSWGILTADLAVTGLNPDSLPQGKVWVTIANNGPDSVTNVSVTLGCSGTEYLLQGGNLSITTVPWTITVSLDPGWSAQFDTTISIDTTQASYELGCSIQVGFKDPNPSNDSLGNVWITP